MQVLEAVSDAFTRLGNYFPFIPSLYLQGDILSVENVPDEHVNEVKMLVFGTASTLSPAPIHLITVHDDATPA